MSAMANITVKDRKKLWVRSGNLCSFPGCMNELIEEDYETILGDEAHIVAENLNGPRGDYSLPTEEVNKYENLILLCKKHHKIIDDNPKYYTVESLHGFKKRHERWVKENLEKKGISDIWHEDDIELHYDTFAKWYAPIRAEKFSCDCNDFTSLCNNFFLAQANDIDLLDEKTVNDFINLCRNNYALDVVHGSLLFLLVIIFI